jgi:hypothetical protein
MGLELKKGLELFLILKTSKQSFILFLCFMCCSFIFNVQQTFVALQFVLALTQKLFNMSRNKENTGKCLVMGSYTLPV